MNRIKELRKQKKVTQQEVAEAIGVTRRGFQKWENGESQITLKNAAQLADYFGVPLSYLLNQEEEWEKLQELHRKLPTVKEFDELHFKKQENRFKRFVQFVSNEDMKVKDRNLVLIFNLLVSSDETFGVNQIYPFPLDEKDEYHFTNQEKSEK
ncbi:DNA-binding helix-turn-helix protein [Streptococcus sp. C300]|jgi:putative transcriptional regulator|uniref:helix-turn-helix domain-containing protein n=1 Tax=Streptococcus TaxID=1301 RepID=UPI0001F895D9|nr:MULTISPECIES: helix-turn-helix transcriptional regulator [Streptococcus]EFX56373.1 DNA-binding helix-turn-helix protein [Streptococcus sp. C300]MCY7077815.1 helix-turn-helix transcriptional regulator [Streptococcus oralis]